MKQMIISSEKWSLNHPLTKDIIMFLRFHCESAFICKGIILTAVFDSTHICCLANRENYKVLKLHGRADMGSAWDFWMPGGPFYICITAGLAWNIWTISEMVRCCTSRGQWDNSYFSIIINHIEFPPFITSLLWLIIEIDPDELYCKPGLFICIIIISAFATFC